MDEKKNISKLFDRIAKHYDGINHVLSLNIDRSWRKQAVKRMAFAEHILDVAVGTGDLSIEILRQGKAHEIVGIDLSEGMMGIARTKIQKEGLDGQITIENGNGQAMRFEDHTFDAVTCAYGLRNFADADEGLREMYRVLKVGGQLIILEFSYPTNRIIRALYDFYFTRIMPLIGKTISKDQSAFIYFCHSVKNFMWGEEMAEHIRQAGFQEVSYLPQTFGISTLYIAKKID